MLGDGGSTQPRRTRDSSFRYQWCGTAPWRESKMTPSATRTTVEAQVGPFAAEAAMQQLEDPLTETVFTPPIPAFSSGIRDIQKRNTPLVLLSYSSIAHLSRIIIVAFGFCFRILNLGRTLILMRNDENPYGSSTQHCDR